MKRSIALLMAVTIALSACGIRRPLVRPADVPAYEAKRAKKRAKFEAPDATQQPSATTPDLNSITPTPSVPE